MEKLSICIVLYKGYIDALKAVESIENNTEASITKTLYIVDNSPTNNLDEAKSFEQAVMAFKDVCYIRTGKNLGFGNGHNYVMPKLKSEYHAIVNPDIIINQDVFKSIITYMDNNPDVGMVIPHITDESGNRQHVYRKEPTICDMFIRTFCRRLFSKRVADHTLQGEDYSKPFQVPFGQGSFLVIRTKLFKELHGFDDNFFMYMEDADLCKRVNTVSALMYWPEANVIHKWEKGSHKSLKLFRVHLTSMMYYFKKWGIKWK